MEKTQKKLKVITQSEDFIITMGVIFGLIFISISIYIIRRIYRKSMLNSELKREIAAERMAALQRRVDQESGYVEA